MSSNSSLLINAAAAGLDEEKDHRKNRRQKSQLHARLPRPLRSEEHTSELQSLRHLVCRLLLEKKKNETHTSHVYQSIEHENIPADTNRHKHSKKKTDTCAHKTYQHTHERTSLNLR